MTAFTPDVIYGEKADERTRRAWIERNFAKLKRWTQVQPEPEVLTYGAQITFNAGDGTPHGDLNATDFTGNPYAEGTTLNIFSNAIVTFGHNAIAYLWTGPTDVMVGVGGNYTAVAADLTPIGTADHSILTNRSLADAHPTAAITGLDAKQLQQDNGITDNQTAINNHVSNLNNPHQVTHDQLVGISPEPDPHPIYQKKLPAMLLGGVADDFTLNTTQSKLVNYTLAAQWHWTDQDDIDPTNGEITIPSTGIYSINGTLIGYQGNDTKEEWMEMRLRIVNGGTTDNRVAEREIPTDKTDIRSLQFYATRLLTENDVLSLWIWGSTGLSTFTVDATTFEVKKIAEQSDIAP